MTDDLRYRTAEWLIEQTGQEIADLERNELSDELLALLHELLARVEALDVLRHCDFMDTTDGNQAHFFLSNATDWVTDTNLPRGIERLARQSMGSSKGFNVFYVPVPPEAHYKILNYAPQVEGKRFIGSFDHKPRKKK